MSTLWWSGWRGRRVASVVGVTAMLIGVMASSAIGATTVPALWTAGGLSAGLESAGQAARMAADALGNVAIVSGPAGGRFLAVTSYTPDGVLRWQRTISPSTGTFAGDWVAAAPNGDFVAIGHNQDSHGRAIASTLVRYDTNGTLLWRVDFSGGFFPSVARLLIDAAGNAYVASSATGTGFFVRKYSPSGALLWSQQETIGDGYSIASSLALSPDETDVAVTGSISGGATWITAVYSATTGVRRWQVAAAEGIANLDVVVDATRVYATGQGNVGINGFLTVVAYDRATGARLWRTDANPPTCCAIGSRIALAPDGSLVVAGHTATGGYFDWWIVAMNTNGTVRWQALRDAALSGDELPAAVFVLADGTTVLSGTGGPVTRDILGNSYMQGVTAGYSSNGTLLWEAFSKLPTLWATALPNGEDVCATGGYDALITCWRVSGTGGTTPTLSIGDVSVTEGNSGTSTATFTVTLSSAASSAITVNYATANATATAGSDYMAASGTLTFAAGTTTRTIPVTVNGDTTGEANETFLVNLSAASGATLADAQGTGTIVNDDSVPTLSIGDMSMTEGNSGTKLATFTVTLSAASASPVSVTYATANGTATAGSDYTATGGSVTFPAGSTNQTLSVTVNGDTTVEPNETLLVNLSGPSGATMLDAQAVGTILNDDSAVLPTLSINDVSVTEGNSGTKTATFTATLSAAASSTATVNYATANGTATAGSDYVARSRTLTFTAGQTTKTIAIVVNGDTTVEPDETFTVNLASPTGATILDGQGVGTILNDDGAALPTLSVGDASVTEGNSGTTTATLTATLSAAASSTVTVNYATANGTATAGSDYVAQSGTLTFTAGQISKTIAVVVNGDTTVEPNETFTVNLTGPVGATLSDAQGVATITNDDAAAGAQPVTWTSLVGVTASGSSLTDIAATGTNAGAASTQSITSGDGYVEFAASETTTNRLLGLSNGNTDASYPDVDFGIALGSGAPIYIIEKGVNRGSFGTYQSGDIFRVAVVGGVVKYSKNGTVFYTSTQTRTYPLLVDTWLYTQGATLQSVVIQGQ